VNGFRNFPLALVLVIFTASFSAASDIYFAQNSAGGNTGADCADAYSITDSSHGINVTGNWVPGNTLHLCGSFSYPSGGTSSVITARASGSSGNPITIKFETNAVITAPYWTVPVISSKEQSYITVDGGTNGTIQATANGTGQANQQDNGIGVYMTGSSNSQVENVTVSNLYVHTCTLPITNCKDEGGQNTYGILWIGGSNVQVGPNNNVHDMKWCAFYGYEATTNAQIFQNTLYHCDHGVVFGDAAPAQTTGSPTATCGGANGNMICQNTIYDGGNWDDAGDQNHHDGIHTWANSAPTSNYYVIIADNYVYGNWGYDMGSLIYIESDERAIPVINNVLASTSPAAAGTGILGVATGTGVGGTGILVANNTVVGASSSNSQAGISISSTTNPVLKNNIVSTTGTAVFINPSGVTGASIDHDDYYNIGASNPFYCPGHSGVSFSVWQSSCGFDENPNGSTGNPLLSNSFSLATGSAAIGLGSSLGSLGISALDSDMAGNPRPSSGAWDAGAYEYQSGNGLPSPPTGLSAQVQ
jgi:hypothetical protein